MNLEILFKNANSFQTSLQTNVPLHARVWFKTGGAAEFLFKPADTAQLQAFLHDCKHAITPLGVGSNVIVRDKGIAGVVVRLGKGFKEITHAGEVLICGGAVLDKTAAQYALLQSMGGLEFLSGIPGTIGGAVRMNAGAYGREIKDVLIWADVIDRQGRLHRLSNADLNFSYRKCQLAADWIVVQAALQGLSKNQNLIKAQMDNIQKKRLATQPQSWTGGSTFANPGSLRAWELIDAAGCRGLRKGGAQVSPLHCNFLVNTGNATAADLEDLGEEVRERVLQHSGVLLEWEIDRLGIK